MGLTSLLCLALVSGFLALVMESVSIGTDYWAAAQKKDSFGSHLSKYLNLDPELVFMNDSLQDDEILTVEALPPTTLLKNKGFWRYCVYWTNDSISSAKIEILTDCKAVNFSGNSLGPNAEPAAEAFTNRVFFFDRVASAFACICAGLQICAVLTSFQATYTTIPVLFTDCGVMFVFAAFFQLVCMVLFTISMRIETSERPMSLQNPQGYKLEYSWSSYLGWGAFLFSLATGVAYFLLARAWETEEVWLKPTGKEKKGGKL